MHRGTKLHATVGGNDQVVDAEFPTEMPVATARDLVLRAVSVMEAAAGPTRCEKPVDRATSFAERPWSQQHSDVLYQAGQSPFVVTAWVEEDFAGGRTLVWFSDSLGIELPSGCWLEWPALIVT
jgi:hypothetical protein